MSNLQTLEPDPNQDFVPHPPQTLFQRLAHKFRRRSTIDVEYCRFDVASHCGPTRAMRMSRNAETLTPNDDLLTTSQYVSEARNETVAVEWKLKDFLHLNKVYMLDHGPSITLNAGRTIDLPIKIKFSLKKIYSTSETRQHIWLVAEIFEAPQYVENVVCKFSTQLFTNETQVKEVNGSPVTMPTKNNRRGLHYTLNVACLIPWDCVYSTEKLLTVKIQVSLFSSRTDGTSDGSNIQETMKKSENAFSTQIGSLLREEEDEEGNRFSDVQLKLKDNTVLHAHRTILACRSSVFHAMILNDLKDPKSIIIDVPPELGLQAMNVILHHIYTGKIDPSCNQIIEEVVYGANMYNLPELLEYCDKIMITVCNQQNALVLLKLAKMHGLRIAIRDVTNYIRMNSEGIVDLITDDCKLLALLSNCNT